MSKISAAALAAALLTLGAAPAAQAGPTLPPTDPVIVDGGGCSPPEPGYPCDPRPYTIKPDKTYPSRVVAWATDLLP